MAVAFNDVTEYPVSIVMFLLSSALRQSGAILYGTIQLFITRRVISVVIRRLLARDTSGREMPWRVDTWTQEGRLVS